MASMAGDKAGKFKVVIADYDTAIAGADTDIAEANSKDACRSHRPRPWRGRSISR